MTFSEMIPAMEKLLKSAGHSPDDFTLSAEYQPWTLRSKKEIEFRLWLVPIRSSFNANNLQSLYDRAESVLCPIPKRERQSLAVDCMGIPESEKP